MRSKKYLWNICLEIYKQLYKESEPSADFDDLMRRGITQKDNWFMDYYLPEERIKEIIDYWCKKHKCNRRERELIEFEIWLGCSPSSVKR